MKLTRDEIVRASGASPMELFVQGIRSRGTLERYTKTHRQVTRKFLEGVLKGRFEKRVPSSSDTRERN